MARTESQSTSAMKPKQQDKTDQLIDAIKGKGGKGNGDGEASNMDKQLAYGDAGEKGGGKSSGGGNSGKGAKSKNENEVI